MLLVLILLFIKRLLDSVLFTCFPLCMTLSHVPGGRNPTDTFRLLLRV
jgi:hypothetical protein